MAQLNSQVGHVFAVSDLSGAAVTGLTAANFTLSLRRRSGSSLIASSETVTIQSIGGGEYWAFYTPTAAATLYVLTVTATAANHLANPYQWQDEITADVVVTAGPYLTTRDRIKAAFGFAQNEHDARIDQLLPQVTDLFQTYCNRLFASATVTEYPAALSSCVRVLLAGRPPITAVTSLHISSGIPRVYDATTLLVEGTHYFVSEDGQWIELISPVSVYGSTIKVAKLIYTGGYAAIPGDLERAAQEVIGVKVLKGSGKLYHVVDVNVVDGGMQGLRWDDVTPNALAVMDSYRLRAFA